MSALLEAALSYSRRGWYVLPVAPRSKTPLGALVPRGQDDATTDEATIRAWWAAQPDANIGIALRPSGLFAFDVDDYHGDRVKLLAAEQRLGELPDTVIGNSGSGQGQHIIYRAPGFAIRGKLDGVTLRGPNYIVVAPSIHPTGGVYAWVAGHAPHEIETATLSAAWLEAIRKPDTAALPSDLGIEEWATSTDGPLTADDETALRNALVALGPRKSGQSTTLRAITLIHHDYGLSIDDGWSLLTGWNAKCGEPHDESELRRQLDRVAQLPRDHAFGLRGHARKSVPAEVRIARAGVRDGVQTASSNAAAVTLKPAPEPGTWAHDLSAALADVQRLFGAVEHGTSSPEPLFEPAVDLLRRDYPEDPWHVRGLVKRSGVALVSGAPKTGKSWALTDIAMAVATGTLALGKFATGAPLRVAYFYAEDLGADVKAHLRALAVGRGLDPEHAVRNLYVQPRGRFLDVLRDDDLALIVASVRRLGGVELLCIEPLRDIHTGEEDKSDSMIAVMRRLRLIGELLGCTVAAAHHNKKATTGDGGADMRGSNAIFGSLDSGVFFSAPGGDGERVITTRVETKIKGARGAGGFDLTLTIDDGPDDRAIKAVWSVDSGASAANAGTFDDAHAATVVEAIQAAELRSERATQALLMGRVKGGKKALDASIAYATTRKLIYATDAQGKPLTKGRKHCGWRLTDAGRAYVAGVDTTPKVGAP